MVQLFQQVVFRNHLHQLRKDLQRKNYTHPIAAERRPGLYCLWPVYITTRKNSTTHRKPSSSLYESMITIYSQSFSIGIRKNSNLSQDSQLEMSGGTRRHPRITQRQLRSAQVSQDSQSPGIFPDVRVLSGSGITGIGPPSDSILT
jgi:hypothetical protein